MEETGTDSSKTKRWLILALKVIITAICLWYVSRKIDFAVAATAIRKAQWLFLFLALVLFIVSKWIAAIRLNIYFRNISIHLPGPNNIRLYWLGMFYNLFLPGSIGGDAYKVIVLTKKFSVHYKKTAAAVVLDRVSGIIGLLIILSAYGSFILKEQVYVLLLVCGTLLLVITYYFFIRTWFKDFLTGFNATLMLGLLVQLLQVGSVYLLMQALHIPLNQHAYIFLFLVSSIASVLPLTIGPLGIRELVFLEGSKYLGLVKETSVTISILFFLITLVTSAFGIIYMYRSPMDDKK